MEHLAAVVFAFVLGTAVASFLNVVADRVPRGQSILKPPSHCPDCGRHLSIAELVPVVSYLALRGKCRACDSRIPLRVLLVELTGGMLFAFAAWWYGGFTLDAVLAAALFAFLLLIAIIDLEHKLVLNKVLLLALPVALLSALMWSPEVREPVLSLAARPVNVLVDAALAGLAGLLIFLVIAIVSRGAMGMGDVKLAGVLGIWLGLRLVPVALALAAVLGGLAAAVLLLSRAFKRKDAIAFAPFLSLGAAAGLVWGRSIGVWYMDLLTP